MEEMNSYDISTLLTYVVCPARAFLQNNSEVKPPKVIVRERALLAVNDLTVRSLDQGEIEEKEIRRVLNRVFEGLEYSTISKDMELLAGSLQNFNYLLQEYELVITGSVVPFEISYGGIILTSIIDMMVKDNKRGYINPVLVDLSNTKYESFYNPILYKCHAAAKHLDISGTNTEVIVLSISSGKRWYYEKRKYEAIIEASIAEMLASMEDDRWPARYGWWCAGCSWRGLCYRLMS